MQIRFVTLRAQLFSFNLYASFHLRYVFVLHESLGAGSSSSGAAANSAEAIVSTFRLGHITMSPVLIISYEVSV